MYSYSEKKERKLTYLENLPEDIYKSEIINNINVFHFGKEQIKYSMCLSELVNSSEKELNTEYD